MPTGVYVRTKPMKPRTEKQLEALSKGRRLPPTQRQIEARRKNARKMGKLPKSLAQIEHARKIGVTHSIFGDDIVEHHNDLCHGAERPNDVSYMAMRKHTSLHNKLRVDNGSHPFLAIY